jgi:TPR repeat protein
VCASCLKTRICSPACARAAWAGHRAACADFTVLAALPDEALEPVPPATPLASMGPAAGAGAFEDPGTGFDCAVCGKADAAVCARCRLVGYCGIEHQRMEWKEHKLVCRKGELGMMPVPSAEQRMLAEAAAAAPASLAATAALPPSPRWDIALDGAPPTKIMKAWRKAAEGGHALAQFEIGRCFLFGKGVAKDAVTAAKCFAKAAVQGHAGAQVSLGELYQLGTGVVQDFSAAAVCFAKAAAQGDADGQTNLGVLFENGSAGVEQNFEAAVGWYVKAAAQGHANGQKCLGGCYDFGIGVAQDFKAAAAWYAKAAAQGHAGAQCNLGVLNENGTGIEQNFKAAAALYAIAVASGHAGATARRKACVVRAKASREQCLAFQKSQLEALSIAEMRGDAFGSAMALALSVEAARKAAAADLSR